MFAREDVYGGYMDKFFAEHHHPAISWIHDLGRGKHGAASQTLLAESQGASDLQIKHVHVKSFCLMSLILTSISYL
jgi:nuclear pore complex protein Nup133